MRRRRTGRAIVTVIHIKAPGASAGSSEADSVVQSVNSGEAARSRIAKRRGLSASQRVRLHSRFERIANAASASELNARIFGGWGDPAPQLAVSRLGAR